MKRQARFEIVVEFEGKPSASNMRIVRSRQEGSFEELTIAMTTGMFFASNKEDSSLETFKKKIRILRATASGLVSGLNILRIGKLYSEVVDEETIDSLGSVLKHTVDLGAYGIARLMDVSADEVSEATKEYINPKDNKDEGKGFEGLDGDDFL